MKRLLLPSAAFIRSTRRFLRKQPQCAIELQLTLEQLSADAFDPRLKTHKWKGKLATSWACSAGYDLRVVVQCVKHKRQDAVLLEGIGTHDEVY